MDVCKWDQKFHFKQINTSLLNGKMDISQLNSKTP